MTNSANGIRREKDPISDHKEYRSLIPIFHSSWILPYMFLDNWIYEQDALGLRLSRLLDPE